jgi:predicted RNA-binding Zn ribbon-like protein
MRSAAAVLDLRGGHPAVDFVNTVAWRGDSARRVDYLTRYADLVAWCRHAGLLTTAEVRQLPSDAEAVVVRAKRLREALHSLWTGGVQPDPVIGESYIGAMRRRTLRATGGAVGWAEPELTARTPLDRIAIHAVELLTGTPSMRIKGCNDHLCGWLFLDTSHRQNRRWCSAADCGNRDRARRHYARSRR